MTVEELKRDLVTRQGYAFKLPYCDSEIQVLHPGDSEWTELDPDTAEGFMEAYAPRNPWTLETLWDALEEIARENSNCPEVDG